MKIPRIGPLYAITDPRLMPDEVFLEMAEAALRGGVDVIQLRDKIRPREQLINLGKKLLKLCNRYNVPLIVNDHPDVAKEIGAHGVHVGKDDPPVDYARKILGPDAIIGASAYDDVNLALELERLGADYVAFGAVFPSPTKPKEPLIDWHVFTEARKVLKVPIVAIGGINKKNLPELMEKAKPDAVAVVSAIFGERDPESAARELKNILARYIKI